jgi:ABC-type multidrug transport system ATPase subunit
MIRLEGIAARRRPLVLASVTARWEAGVHSLLGTRADGGPLVLALIAGAARARAGSVRVLDGDPGSTEVRARVAHIPLDVALPDALRVDEALSLAAALRGDPLRPASERLAPLGLEALAPRRVGSLSWAEARGVALAEAVTSTRVRVLLVEEPFVAMDPRASSRIAAQLRGRGAAGCAVLVDTASPRDAAEVATDHLLLRAGHVLGTAESLEDLAAATPAGAQIRIVTRDADSGRALSQSLAGDPDVRAVERVGAAVVARGASAVSLAQAAGRALVGSGVDVSEIRVEPPSLEEARGSLAATR